MGMEPVRYSKRSIIRFLAEIHKEGWNPRTRCEMWKWAVAGIAKCLIVLTCRLLLIFMIYWAVTTWGWGEVKILFSLLGLALGVMVALVLVVAVIAFAVEAPKAIAASQRFIRLKQTLCRPVELE